MSLLLGVVSDAGLTGQWLVMCAGLPQDYSVAAGCSTTVAGHIRLFERQRRKKACWAPVVEGPNEPVQQREHTLQGLPGLDKIGSIIIPCFGATSGLPGKDRSGE